MRWGFVHPVVHWYGSTFFLVFVVLELYATQALELEFLPEEHDRVTI
jgi:hypothetical protein